MSAELHKEVDAEYCAMLDAVPPNAMIHSFAAIGELWREEKMYVDVMGSRLPLIAGSQVPS